MPLFNYLSFSRQFLKWLKIIGITLLHKRNNYIIILPQSNVNKSILLSSDTEKKMFMSYNKDK